MAALAAGGGDAVREAALLESWKAYKRGFQQGIALFNAKPKKGVAFLQARAAFVVWRRRGRGRRVCKVPRGRCMSSDAALAAACSANGAKAPAFVPPGGHLRPGRRPWHEAPRFVLCCGYAPHGAWPAAPACRLDRTAAYNCRE